MRNLIPTIWPRHDRVLLMLVAIFFAAVPGKLFILI